MKQVRKTHIGSPARWAWSIAVLVAVAVMGACSPGQRHERLRSAYYWSTTFEMDSAKTAFLRDHHIGRLYVRYFDVVPDERQGAVPNATIRWKDPVPEAVAGNVVPVVFILNDCMKGDTSDLAQKIVGRILQMNETHDIGRVPEVQIDCDWTASTEQTFFEFLRRVKAELQPHGIGLSVTIRLHQLRQAAPPADRGVLMMYNTGDFSDLADEHPILDMRVALPYLRHLPDYPLSLSAAYPLYRWDLLFRGQQFVGILHGDDLPMLAGDSIVVRQPSLDEIVGARRQLDEVRSDVNDEIILYELNDYNITRFNSYDYETIFND